MLCKRHPKVSDAKTLGLAMALVVAGIGLGVAAGNIPVGVESPSAPNLFKQYLVSESQGSPSPYYDATICVLCTGSTPPSGLAGKILVIKGTTSTFQVQSATNNCQDCPGSDGAYAVAN